MTIEWKIEQMDRQTSDGLVTTVHWRANATEDSYFATCYGSVGLSAGESLIPFADLTKEMVMGWVQDKLGAEQVAQIEDSLAAQIESQKAPATASGLPEAWTAVTE